MERYRRTFWKIFAITLILYAGGIVLDAFPAVRLFARKNVIIFAGNICLADKMDTMVGFYGVIWTITTGTVVFVIQRGYANVLGLSMVEILSMVFCEPLLVCGGVLILCRVAVFLGIYLLEMKCTMVCAITVLTIHLLFIGKCFFSLPEIEAVKELLISSKGEITDKQSENILKVSQKMNYDDNQECEALVEILASYIRQMQDLDWDVDESWNKNNAAILIEQESMINEIVEKMYYGAGERSERVNYLIKNVLIRLEGESVYKKYILIKSVLLNADRSIVSLEKIIQILQIVEEDDSLQILKKLIVYIGFLCIRLGEMEWNKVVLNKLLEEYGKYVWSEETSKWGDSAVVFYMEYQKYELEKKGFSAMEDITEMKIEYIRLLNEIKEKSDTTRGK